jgi:hypothetical protein
LRKKFLGELGILERLAGSDEYGTRQVIRWWRRCGPIQGKFFMVGLRLRNVDKIEVLPELSVDPRSGGAAASANHALCGMVDHLIHQVDGLVTAKRDAGFQQQHFAAMARHEGQGLGGMAEVVERPVAIDNVKGLPKVNRVLEIEVTYVNRGIALPKMRKVSGTAFGGYYGAAPIEEEAGVVSYPGGDLEHAGAGDGQAEADKVFLPALVVPEIELGVKSGVGGPASAGPHSSSVNFSCRRTEWSGNQSHGLPAVWHVGSYPIIGRHIGRAGAMVLLLVRGCYV